MRRRALSQPEQLANPLSSSELAAGFRATVADTETRVTGGGPFHPARATTLRGLLERFGPLSAERIGSTHDVAAVLWAPRRWDVVDHPELAFYYVTREVTPGSVDAGDGRREQQAQKVSSDLLLVNANDGDNTPIVAEVKVRNDQNALLALVQALASAAQLSPPHQLARLRGVYPDLFGETAPECLDVYVIAHDPPPRGVRPQLHERAVKLAGELTASGELSEWIRRIAFLRSEYARDDGLRLRADSVSG